MIRFTNCRRGFMAALAAVVFTCHGWAQEAAIVIEDKVAGLIPIHITGYTGEVDQTLKFDLEVAGFVLVSPEKARYTLTGKNGTQVEGTLADNAKRAVLARSYPGGTPRAQAHSLSDDVVQAVTGLSLIHI